jgi:putative endonuclease
MKIHLYYVYILTNTYNNVLYTGITNDLVRRCFEHKQKRIKGFTQKYNITKLVYFEKFDYVDLAIAREKQIKVYSRIKKIALINSFNIEWNDLYNNGRIEVKNIAKSEIKNDHIEVDSSPREKRGSE